MIVRFAKPGSSFKGVALYLAHDPDKALTSERVAWTHTLNLAHDHVPSAVHEMFCTARDAGLLKEEAGVRPGGSKVVKPVRHISLNWHPTESPDGADMATAAESFLRHMGWQEHQTIVVAHTDKDHPHVHLVVNAIHPVTGRKLDDGFEKRRAQAWALAYEQERGKVFCEERLKPIAEREGSETRPAWLAGREQVERELAGERERFELDPSYLGGGEARRTIERREWEILKELQKDERLAFFESGRQAYRDLTRAVYCEVGEEFRSEWGDYYAAKRSGADVRALAEQKADLVARQYSVLDERREEAAAALRAERDRTYRMVLDAQKQERAELADRQEQGLRSPHLLGRAYPGEEEGREQGAAVDALDASASAGAGMTRHARPAADIPSRARSRRMSSRGRLSALRLRPAGMDR